MIRKKIKNKTEIWGKKLTNFFKYFCCLQEYFEKLMQKQQNMRQKSNCKGMKDLPKKPLFHHFLKGL